MIKNEFVDLPMNLQDTPNHILEKNETFNILPDAEETADLILSKLESYIKGSQEETLYRFMEAAFPATNSKHFGDKPWPSSEALESKFDKEYKIGAQALYNEYIYRNEVYKFQTEDKWLDSIDMSWENYTSIFELEATRINFHPIMIWFIFQNFINHYNYYHSDQPEKRNIERNKLKNTWFQKDKIKEIFNKLRGKIGEVTGNPTSLQVFGYYSLIAEAAMEVNDGNYGEALNILSGISLREVSIFAKGSGSILYLFYLSSFCYWMIEDYQRSAKISELIVHYFQKHRKHFNRSAHFDSLQRIHEKNVTLLCLNFIFLEEKPKSTIMDIFKNIIIRQKDKQSSEKVLDSFYKLKQNDTKTMEKLFAVIKGRFAIKDVEKIVIERFKSLQSITLHTIIQHYKRISLKKMGKMLGMSEQAVEKEVNKFESLEKARNNWDETIMNPLLRQRKKVKVEIEDGIVIIESQSGDSSDFDREWARYREEMHWLIDKVQSL